MFPIKVTFCWSENIGRMENNKVDVRAKIEAGGPTLTWAHNLFMIWVLNFLLWVAPYTETQRN